MKTTMTSRERVLTAIDHRIELPWSMVNADREQRRIRG